MTFTRKQYMDGECTHDQYYDQFVTQDLKNTVLRSIPEKQIIWSKDESFNDIPLRSWDWMARLNPVEPKKFKEFGDFTTLAGQVSALKAAARQIREESARRPVPTYL